MPELSIQDIQTSDSSYVDPNGFVFLFQNRIFRGIRSENEAFYRSLIASGDLDRLSRQYFLIESEPTDYSIPELNCQLVIRHPRVEPLTYCVEWCPSMLKAGARTTLELCLELDKKGRILQDAYPWNILFEGTRPVFVDWTSIVSSKTIHYLWPALQQFMNFFINPLKLCAMGKGKTARLMLQDYINGIPHEEVVRQRSPAYILRHPVETTLEGLAQTIEKKLQGPNSLRLKLQEPSRMKAFIHENPDARKKFFERLLNKLGKIPNTPANDNWVHYYKQMETGIDGTKTAIVGDLISRLAPETVLDAGCNVGNYSIIAAREGARVIAMDPSEPCIEALYRKAREESYRITPVIGDILNPTPAFGFLSRQFPPMIERFQSDIVLCLALMHHLHINGRQSLARIAALMNALSRKAVIFEYVDPADENINLLDHGRKIDYTLAAVMESLSKYFKLSTFDSDRETRRILLCEK